MSLYRERICVLAFQVLLRFMLLYIVDRLTKVHRDLTLVTDFCFFNNPKGCQNVTC